MKSYLSQIGIIIKKNITKRDFLNSYILKQYKKKMQSKYKKKICPKTNTNTNFHLFPIYNLFDLHNFYMKRDFFFKYFFVVVHWKNNDFYTRMFNKYVLFF